jgi:thioredoxin-related protein
MKLLVALLTLAFSLWAANIDDFAASMQYHRDYASALPQAKKEHKLIMLVLVSDYCPWCRKMEHKTLESDMVRALVKERFVPVIVDRNLDKARYPAKYDVPRIPTIFFIDPVSEEHLYESIAYVKRQEFLKTLEEVDQTFRTGDKQ